MYFIIKNKIRRKYFRIFAYRRDAKLVTTLAGINKAGNNKKF